MDLRRALTAPFRDRRWPIALAPVMLAAWLPFLGPLWVAAYAQRVLARAIAGDETLPPFRLDGHTLRLGAICHLLTISCGIVAGLLVLPLWPLERETPPAEAATTALTWALAGPTHLTATVLQVTLAAICLARFAATDSARAALDPGAIWAHLRAEPAIWIATSVTGFLIAQFPVTLVWLAPLSAGYRLALGLAVQALIVPLAALVQSQLVAQAFAASTSTLTWRRARVVRVRW